MIKYDRTFLQPAPIVEVEVANPYKSKSKKVKGKIDTGADISAIPTELLDKLSLEWSGSKKVHGFNQKRVTKVKTFRVDISFESRKFELVEVILTPNPRVLIGRDILNQLTLLLDGKNFQFQIME